MAAEPHDWLNSTGGAIGCGPPLATGAAVGAPGRRVIALQADGSGMYTLQALWTQAREKLDVTTVLLSNRKYQILLGELANVGANPGRTALDMLDLGNPDLDWTKLAEGMGVEAARVETIDDFVKAFRGGCARRGPFLIEVMILWAALAHAARWNSIVQFISQKAPPSGEKACSQRHETGVMCDQRKRTRMGFPARLSSA